MTKHILMILLLSISKMSIAGLVTVEPDDFANGTNINNAYPGVTLSAEGLLIDNGTFSADIYSIEASYVHPALEASTGTRIFNVRPAGLFPRDWLIAEFRADFTQSTNFVSLDFIGFKDPNNPDPDEIGIGVLAAYDAADNLLTQISTGSLGLNDIQTLSISWGGSDIAYIKARTSGIDTPILVDHLTYSVPAPGTLLLFSLGLALMTLRRRKGEIAI